jgi:hypothetical protein
MLSIAWLELGDWETGIKFLQISLLDQTEPFHVYHELPQELGGGCNNFITGAGGFLQVLLAGYGGMRIQSNNTVNSSHIAWKPTLPDQVTGMKWRGISFGSFVFDLEWETSELTPFLQVTFLVQYNLNNTNELWLSFCNEEVQLQVEIPFVFDLQCEQIFQLYFSE